MREEMNLSALYLNQIGMSTIKGTKSAPIFSTIPVNILVEKCRVGHFKKLIFLQFREVAQFFAT
jgi:hypothetical protein